MFESVSLAAKTFQNTGTYVICKQTSLMIEDYYIEPFKHMPIWLQRGKQKKDRRKQRRRQRRPLTNPGQLPDANQWSVDRNHPLLPDLLQKEVQQCHFWRELKNTSIDNMTKTSVHSNHIPKNQSRKFSGY